VVTPRRLRRELVAEPLLTAKAKDMLVVTLKIMQRGRLYALVV
jgi:hypothetical protein